MLKKDRTGRLTQTALVKKVLKVLNLTFPRAYDSM